ncbi:hypothetical protein V6N13_126991 [Hibiscus sabdariffa]|uniref:Uncharacterized protein n=1 Tax=Hibiscus sabdariffa TaxID=183260 RepID=A0ABR2RE09_9ROSI
MRNPNNPTNDLGVPLLGCRGFDPKAAKPPLTPVLSLFPTAPFIILCPFLVVEAWTISFEFMSHNRLLTINSQLDHEIN